MNNYIFARMSKSDKTLLKNLFPVTLISCIFILFLRFVLFCDTISRCPFPLQKSHPLKMSSSATFSVNIPRGFKHSFCAAKEVFYTYFTPLCNVSCVIYYESHPNQVTMALKARAKPFSFCLSFKVLPTMTLEQTFKKNSLNWIWNFLLIPMYITGDQL